MMIAVVYSDEEARRLHEESPGFEFAVVRAMDKHRGR